MGREYTAAILATCLLLKIYPVVAWTSTRHVTSLKHWPTLKVTITKAPRAKLNLKASSREAEGGRELTPDSNHEDGSGNFFDFPRDSVSLAYLSFGVCFTVTNLLGNYEHYDTIVRGCLLFGGLSLAAMLVDSVDPPPVPSVDGPGYINRRTITRFGAAYMAAAMWVCWRTSPFFFLSAQEISASPSLRLLDMGANLASAVVFVYGVVAPLVTLASSHSSSLSAPSSSASSQFSSLLLPVSEPDDLDHNEPLLLPGKEGAAPLTEVQRLLLNGSIIQNVIGATFLPVVLTMMLRGPLWWEAVHEQWPMQTLLEPSTSTFAGLSVDSGLLLMRLASRGKLSWAQVVYFGTASAVFFAVVPCACFLYYNDGLFDWFSLYSIPVAW
eukprot:CAMPEP_0171925646 /NCGR_PEP_ID=MMETSP0993-20121228/24177_1 /TAXON_ID=483369 /ORGANISM="non described non described, Strain CCMP2098" /LENGTH=382 /DNA_ID=CAMNT_0012564291 /DNA_START=49 /DNA_END=1197 /DNA_ORIENTATION=-